MHLSLGGVRVAPPGNAVPVAHVAVPVVGGRVSLGRLARIVGVEPPADVQVVAGFRSACWVGPSGAEPPVLGRLVHRASARLDGRGRVVLDRHVRGYLGVADPGRFDALLVSLPSGGVLVVPVADAQARLGRVESA